MSEHDIAVSFAEDVAVEEVVAACRQRGLTVLYEPEHTHEWWARKSAGDLPDARVRFFVPFIAAIDDFTAAMLRAVKAGDEHVLPVLVDDLAVPAELQHPHVNYLRLNDRLPSALASRVERAETAGRDRAELSEVVTKAREAAPSPAVPFAFSRYAEQDATMRYLGEQLAAAVPGLRRRGYVGTAHYSDARIALRVERADNVVYALDIQRGGIGGDETVNFVVGRHDTGSACTNGWVRPVYDAGEAKLELHDRTVFGGADTALYTRDELFTALWDRINTMLTP